VAVPISFHGTRGKGGRLQHSRLLGAEGERKEKVLSEKWYFRVPEGFKSRAEEGVKKKREGVLPTYMNSERKGQ